MLLNPLVVSVKLRHGCIYGEAVSCTNLYGGGGEICLNCVVSPSETLPRLRKDLSIYVWLHHLLHAAL